MTAALQDLLARLEAAEGPDRELDDAVALAFGWRKTENGWRDPSSILRAQRPRFSNSLDAVIALARRLGFYIRSEPFFHIDDERVDFVSWALLPKWGYWTPMDDEWFDRGEARHADPVLSAACALVKALIAQQAPA